MKEENTFDRLNEMVSVFIKSRKEVLPSKYWMELNQKNIQQLEEFGYNNFKRTIAHNYFTWVIKTKFWQDDQIRYLYTHLPKTSVVINFVNAVKALFIRGSKFLKIRQTLIYNFLTYMLWDFSLRNDNNRILNRLSEPFEGNPPRLFSDKKLISQDLANSFFEYQSIMSVPDTKDIQSIMELGSGYGRTAYVFLKLIPNIKYIIVDIPPALYISEKYLSNQFKRKKIFKFRSFKKYEEIKNEFEQADLVFLLPGQLELLPSKIIDFFINISSLQEMKKKQIDYYFNTINRLIKKYIYIKQWKISKNPSDNIIITERDYPILDGWKQVYWRECKVKTKFFEALFKVD